MESERDQVLNGLFAVEEDQPDGVAVELFSARGFGVEPVADGHQQAGGCGAVVGADKVDVPERVVGFVVRAEHDDAGLFAGEAHDEVAHGHRADGRVGGEGVFFKLVVRALEVAAQKLFGLDVAGAGGPARADGDKLARVLKRFGAVEVLLGMSGRADAEPVAGQQNQRPRASLLPAIEGERLITRSPWLLWPCAARDAPTTLRRCRRGRAPAWELRRCTWCRDRGWGR